MPPKPTPPAIERARLDVLAITLSAAGAVELIDAYLADQPKLIASLASALASGDASAVRRCAHTLKSTSDSLGAKGLAELCGALEGDARAGDLGNAAAQLEEIQRQAAAAQAELQQARAHLAAGADGR